LKYTKHYTYLVCITLKYKKTSHSIGIVYYIEICKYAKQR